MPTTDGDTAVVVFMRPAYTGNAIQASVFEVVDDRETLIGVVSYRTKVAKRVPAGSHLFMVVGESADFMNAEVEAGRTYYALVSPRMGVWKARFSLEPIRRADLEGKEFVEWDRECTLVEPNEQAAAWARDNAPDITEKRIGYLAKWKQKTPEEIERYTLHPTDWR